MTALVGIGIGAGLTIGTGYCLGQVLTRRHEIAGALRWAVGMAALSGVSFLLLAAGLARRESYLAVSVLAIAAWWRWGRQAARWPRPAWSWLVLGPYAVVYFVHALAPEVQPDAVTYHLGLVREWLANGGFTARADFYSVMPLGLDALFAMAYAFGQHSAAKLVHASFLAASAVLIAHLARRWGRDGVAAAALWVATPVVGICGTAAYADVGWAFYALAAFALLAAGAPGLAGVAAGMCAAVKLPGVIVVMGAVGWILARFGARSALRAGVLAVVVAGPWWLRTYVMTGSPVAPLVAGWWPTEYFHWSTVDGITQYFRAAELGWSGRVRELLFRGLRLSGLIGPVFAFAPLGLVALRRGAGRAVWLAAAVAFVPAWWNAEARFLLPALGFVILALAIALSRPLVWGLAAAHLVVCWPWSLDWWLGRGAWRLEDLPWRAALRIESEPEYLRRKLDKYLVAEKIDGWVGAGARPILDLTLVPWAYVAAPMEGYWHSARAERAVKAMVLAATQRIDSFYALRGRWEAVPLDGVRVEITADADEPWHLLEVEVRRGEQLIRPTADWKVRAEPVRWEAALALDRNVTTGWHTWRPRKKGMFWQVEWPAAREVSDVRLAALRSYTGVSLRMEVRRPGGDWVVVSTDPERIPYWVGNLKRRAGRALAREGFGYVLADTAAESFARVAEPLQAAPEEWGLERVGAEGTAMLLRVRAESN